MAVAVHFPDGIVRDVPGQLRKTGGDAGSQTFQQVPLNCDSRWRYRHGADGWYAVPRLGHLAVLRPPMPEWWCAIVQMEETVDDAVQRQNSAA